ncbi:retrovirus-related Pol polyprotein from transposon 17.6 [Trichonephila clavipes]|nr:retrovirus-related Pol polyprotein from transposon 17.6 [Trichonephila clavipes]
MGHVDCLSRYPVMTITYDEVTTKLANCQRNDEYINSLKTLLENKQINDFVVKNDVLYKIENDNDVLVVPQQMQTEIVKNIHSKGHLGINKTESMRTLNSTISRSTRMTPFQLLPGVKMRTKQDLEILKLLEEEIVETFTENREKIREEAKRNILKMQEENCRNFNKKRKKAYQYEIGDIVAIQRTQFGTGLKLRPKFFFGPYEVIKVKPKDRYDVRKIGLHDGPNTTSTAADHMKMWGGTV